MEPLTPLPLDLFKEVIAYFDDFAEGTLQCFTDWFSCGSKGAEDFEKNVLPKLQQRRVGDDDELFAGTSHCGGFYGMLCGPDAINGVLAQFYRSTCGLARERGLSGSPKTSVGTQATRLVHGLERETFFWHCVSKCENIHQHTQTKTNTKTEKSCRDLAWIKTQQLCFQSLSKHWNTQTNIQKKIGNTPSLWLN